MSDIYLSLTETPSVVTLSQPVISSSVAATVTVGNTVTVALDANSLAALESITVTVGNVSIGSSVSVSNFPASSAVSAYGIGTDLVWRGIELTAGSNRVKADVVNTSGGSSFPISGSVTLGAGTQNIGTVTVGNSVTIGSLPNISGTVTANLLSSAGDFIGGITETIPNQAVRIGWGSEEFFHSVGVYSGGAPLPVQIVQSGYATSVTANIGNTVTIGSLPAISGTVTAAAPNGSLTTRFGTPTTANTAFATSAVTNANRKYLLIQNVTTGSNVITVGIGFTPTTTQGIQLTAGAGITFESSYIPTGAVMILSSVTASNFTVLEA